MGRKNWKESKSESKKGPGKKVKKQGDPELPAKLQGEVKRTKSAGDVGGRIKQRARKRTAKAAVTKALKQGTKRVKPKDVKANYKSVPPPASPSPPPPPSRSKGAAMALFAKTGSDGDSGELNKFNILGEGKGEKCKTCFSTTLTT